MVDPVDGYVEDDIEAVWSVDYGKLLVLTAECHKEENVFDWSGVGTVSDELDHALEENKGNIYGFDVAIWG